MKKISILIALRNEEKIILSCLENLQQAIHEFYKTEKNTTNFEVEILIGDDNSTDLSATIITKFIQATPQLNFKYFKISENKNQKNLKGKANVIQNLIWHSKGETIILLDADILVTQNWLNELLKKYYQNENVKMLMGTTIPRLSNGVINVLSQRHQQIFTTFQVIDWISGQGVLFIFSKLGFPQTAMGNNLVFDKKIYQEIGGYSNIEFSATEDVALFKSFQDYESSWRRPQKRQEKNNQFFLQLFNTQSLAFTEPETTLKDWILQRHRWFCGAWQFANFFKKIVLICYLFRVIFLIGLILSGNTYLIFAVFASLGINYLLILSFFIKLKLKISLFNLLSILIFSLTESFFYFLVGIYFLKTKKVRWKNREF